MIKKSLFLKYTVKIPDYIYIFYSEKNRILTLKGPVQKNSLKLKLKINILYKIKRIQVTNICYKSQSRNEKKKLKCLQGTLVALIKQSILEVSTLLCKKLIFIGVGFKGFLLQYDNNNLLHLKLGFSHDIYVRVAQNVKMFCFKSNRLFFILGSNYFNVARIAAVIRSQKLPEPYKGKGILYENEKIIRKEGKKL